VYIAAALAECDLINLYVLFEIDFFSLGGLFSHNRPGAISRELFYPRKTYSLIYTRLFENLQASIIKSIITRSEMGQQTAQAKKVY